MTTLIDQATRDAATKVLHTSFFVEAGAGTGKTTVLVGRVLQIIRSGSATIEQIVVLTFTEKAAAELRDRIRADLHNEIAEGDGTGNAGRALSALDTAHIETIYAFASSILREHPIQSGIDPNFVQLDEVAEDVDFDDRWENWLWEGNREAEAVLGRCIDLGLRIQEDLRGVAKNFLKNRDVAPRLTQADRPDVSVTLGRLCALRDEGLALAASCTGERDRSVQALHGFRDRLDVALEARAEELELAVFSLRVSAQPGGKANWVDQEAREALAACLAELQTELDAYREALRRSLTGEVAEVLWAFAQRTASERIGEGALSFEDLLIEAARVVREAPEVRERLQYRYRFFLIDEFQDTDPLQAEIIFRLAAQRVDEEIADWSSLTIVPGRLFLVGDPKQSIYRFRRADIAVYAAAKDAFTRLEAAGAGAQVVSLVQNFRSVRTIVDWVNAIFQQIIVPVPGLHGAQPDYEQIHAARADLDRGVVHIYPQANVEGGRIADVRGPEAKAIAATIAAIVQRTNVTTDRDAHGPLKVSFRDMCILIDTRTALDTYLDALTELGIPYVTDSGNLFERQEVRDLAAILRTLDDPSDTTSLVAALKSDAFSCSDEDLLRYKVGGGQFSILAPARKDDPVGRAIVRLRALYEAKARLALPSFVDLVIRESFLIEALLLDPRERQRAANLKLISQRARDFASKDMDSLRPFIRWVSSRQDLRPREAESQLAETDDDVVRVMTVHGAKGLEFPVVFLAKLAAGIWSEQPEYIVDRVRGLLEFRVGREHNRFATPGFEAAREQELLFEEAEECRKLYVAATRACDYLIVPVFKSDENPGRHRWLPMLPAPQAVRQALQDKRDAPTIAGARVVLDTEIHGRRVVSPPPDEVASDLVSRWSARLQGVHAKLSAGPRFVVPSELGHDQTKEPRETEPLDWDEPEQALDLIAESGQALGLAQGSKASVFSGSRSGRERGTLIHDVLARCDFDDPSDGRKWVERLCAHRGAHGLVDEVRAHVERVYASPDMGRVRRALRTLREVPIVTYSNETYLEGVVDLLFEEEDGWVLVDYKSDALGTDEQTIIDRYRPQLEAYQVALSSAGVKVKSTGLWLTSNGALWIL